jgi:hypothetical protein
LGDGFTTQDRKRLSRSVQFGTFKDYAGQKQDKTDAQGAFL